MSVKCGIVGLPNVGKSTLFNALTKSQAAAAENYPFCTIDPTEGSIAVPDPCLDKLAEMAKPQRVMPAMMTFVDIAGLVAGAAQGEGLGNQFLGHIRETQAILHVVRCFNHADVIHVNGQVNPMSDVETIDTELALADLETVEKAEQKIAKAAKTGDKIKCQELELIKPIRMGLSEGKSVRSLSLTTQGIQLAHQLQLLTAKPVLYVGNVDEGELDTNIHWQALQSLAERQQSQAIAISAALESEIAELVLEEQQAFLADLHLTEPGLNRLIRAGYELLGLHNYFTVGPKEVRAWTIPIGTTAVKAAGVIHTDFEKGFIRAEVIGYDDYIGCGGEVKAKESGKWRLEGKEYIVSSRDIIYFRTAT